MIILLSWDSSISLNMILIWGTSMNTTYQLLTQNGVAPIHSVAYLGLDHMVDLLIYHGVQVDLKMKVRKFILVENNRKHWFYNIIICKLIGFLPML